MRRLPAALTALVLGAAGCGSDAEKKPAATPPEDSVVLGTDPVPTAPRRTTPRRTTPAPERERRRPRRPSAPAPPAPRAPGPVTMIGDSLAVGTLSLLPAALPGWTVRSDARKGRTTAEGMQVLRAAPVAPGSVVAFSLFTNDPPGATGALRAALEAGAAKVGPQGCQVWATITRPVPGGGGEPANELLRGLDGDRVAGTRVVVADWAELVARRPALLAPDGVHGTPEGYRARARLYAAAVRRCAT